jgi:hypothetical protein
MTEETALNACRFRSKEPQCTLCVHPHSHTDLAEQEVSWRESRVSFAMLFSVHDERMNALEVAGSHAGWG